MTGLAAAGMGATTVGTAALGGVFLAFSTFVMPALRRLPPRDGLTAMHSINEAAPRALGAPLVVTALASAALGVHAATTRDSGAALVATGSALYLTAFGVTIAYHVPRNDALATVEPGDPAASDAWASYVAGWVPWNHVRTAACLASTAAYLLSLTR